MSKMILFGIQTAIAKPKVTTGVPNAYRFEGIQEISLTTDAGEEELPGQNDFPEDVALTTRKLSGEIKFSHLRGRIISKVVYPNSTEDAGQITLATREVGEADATTHDYDAVEAATFEEALVVEYSATGEPLERVAATPTTGQYTVDEGTGNYVFAAGDAPAHVTGGLWFTYMYRKATGKTVEVIAQPVGELPEFSLFLFQRYKGQDALQVLRSAIFKKHDWMMGSKKHVVPSLGFSAYADLNDKVLRAGLSLY